MTKPTRGIDMTTLSFKTALASVLLGLPSIAGAHTGHHDRVSSFHFLTSPDHVVAFVLLGLTGAAVLLWLAQRSRNAEKK